MQGKTQAGKPSWAMKKAENRPSATSGGVHASEYAPVDGKKGSSYAPLQGCHPPCYLWHPRPRKRSFHSQRDLEQVKTGQRPVIQTSTTVKPHVDNTQRTTKIGQRPVNQSSDNHQITTRSSGSATRTRRRHRLDGFSNHKTTIPKRQSSTIW